MRGYAGSAAAVALLLTAVPGVQVAADGVPTVEQAPVCAIPGQVTLDRSGWRHAKAPRFATSPADILHSAIDPLTPEFLDGERNVADQFRVYASNGHEVAQSVDSGCHWTTVYTPTPDSIESALQSESEIVDLQAAHWGPYLDDDVYVVGRQLVAGQVRRPFVAVRKQDGSFVPGAGLPVFADVVDFSVSRLADHCAWMLTRPLLGPTAGGRDLYRSTDEGATWSRMAEGVPVEALVDTTTQRDLTTCDDVWGRGGRTLWSSHDGGSTFAAAFVAPAVISSASVQPRFRLDKQGAVTTLVPTGLSSIDVFTEDRAWYELAGDARVLRHETTPGVGNASATPNLIGRDPVVVLTPEGVFQHAPQGGSWIDVSPDGKLPADLTANYLSYNKFYGAHGSPTTVAGSTTTELLIKAAEPRPGQVLFKPRLSFAPFGDQSALLTPVATRLAVRPGQSVPVDFDFRLPQVAAALDVDFEIDTTSSMDPAIKGLRESAAGIVKALNQAGLDLYVGIGEFKDFSRIPSTAGEEPPFVYKRRLRLTPPGDSLVNALTKLKQSGGLPDVPEAQTVALDQVLSGAGQGTPPDVLSVEPGQEARFRKGATKVLVLITDSDFHRGPNYPALQAVSTRLREAGVLVVSAVTGGGADQYLALQDASTLARATGAIAGAAGMDCNGDGKADVLPGEPLVCLVRKDGQRLSGIGNTVATLVLNGPMTSRAGFGVRGDVRAVQRLVGGGTPPLVRSAAVTRHLRAYFTCGAADVGKDLRVEVLGLVWNAPVAVASVTVQCRGQAAAPSRPALPFQPPGVDVHTAAVPAPPAPVPGAQVPVQAPNLNPATQPGAQGAAGTAAEAEQSPELAVARQEGDPSESPAMLLMSALVLSGTAAAVRRQRARGLTFAESR
jgi:hypothetical protein